MTQPLENTELSRSLAKPLPTEFLDSARTIAYSNNLRDNTNASLSLDAQDKQTGKSQDKPKTEAEKAAEEAQQLLRAMVSDAAAGKWGEKSKEGWKKLVDQEKNIKGATPEFVADALNLVGAALNDVLQKQGSKNRVGMAIQEDAKTGESRFYMKLKGPGIKEADNLKAILDNKDNDTCINVGSMKSKK